MILEAGPLRVRTLGSGDGPAVVLCHGYGAPGDDLVPLARVIDAGPSVRFFFPEAPLEIDFGYGPKGRAWWPVDMMRLQLEIPRGGRRWDEEAIPEGFFEARDALVATLRALVERGAIDPSRTVVGGFSQGAMIATEIVLHGDELALPFSRLVALSGALLSRARWTAALARNGSRLRILQSHGRSDPILPFGVAERLHALFLEHGAHASFVPFPGEHEIPPAVLDRVGSFARETLKDG